MALVNDELLLAITDCDTLDEIRVVSLRDKRIQACLNVLARCPNLTIAYLQNNMLQVRDLSFLHMFRNLKKIDLSDNGIEALPHKSVFEGLN